MNQLRDYQARAVQAVWRHLETLDNNPVVVCPTGGGKSYILAALCRDAVSQWGGRVLVLQHVRELIEQNFAHLMRLDPSLPVGLYSAGLGIRNTRNPIIVAGIQSVYHRMEELGRFDLIIIDEAHRLRVDDEGMYVQCIKDAKAANPNLRVIGTTATPYRMTTGPICAKDNLLNRICFEVSIRELISKGYLTNLITRGGTVDTDFSGVRVRGGEFVQPEMEALMAEDSRVAMAVADIIARAKDRKKILVFCSGVEHGRKVAQLLRENDQGEVAEVYGHTPYEERDEAIKSFREGSLRCLVNVEVLTLGFDAPNVDCVALLRATMSPGLMYQMIGRGFRIAEGKESCLVLDLGGNIVRHGPIDAIEPTERKSREGNGQAPAKKCPDCCAIVLAAVMQCPECGHAFPPREPKHETSAYDGKIISDTEEVEVRRVRYSEHVGRESRIPSLRVDYFTEWEHSYVSEFVCLEHGGYAGEKARQWWGRRLDGDVPETVEEALELVPQLAEPTKILVKYEGKYPRVKAYRFSGPNQHPDREIVRIQDPSRMT